VVGEPFAVPMEADDARIEVARLELERRLAALEQRALALLASR